MVGTNFPIADYYRTEIIDAQTISRKGGWWTAALLIMDPKTKRPFVALYRWQHTEAGWKIRKRFTFRRVDEIRAAFAAITELGAKLGVAATEAEVEDEDPSTDERQIVTWIVVGKCPRCGAQVRESEDAYMCEESEEQQKPCKFKIGKVILHQPIDCTQAAKLLSEGKTDLLCDFVSKAGRKFQAYLLINDLGKVTFEFPPST